MNENLLRQLATHRTPTEPLITRYDPQSQMSQILDESGHWVASWKSSRIGDTKKCDLETGEDQKGQ